MRSMPSGPAWPPCSATSRCSSWGSSPGRSSASGRRDRSSPPRPSCWRGPASSPAAGGRGGGSQGWLALLGLTSQSIGYLLISMSLPRLPAALVSIILLVQPVATVLLARVLLAEAPSLFQVAGVDLIIGGIPVPTLPLGRLRDP